MPLTRAFLQLNRDRDGMVLSLQVDILEVLATRPTEPIN